MAGQGKYTTYLPPGEAAKAKMDLLTKLYPGGDKTSPIFDAFKKGKTNEVIAQELSNFGNEYIYGIVGNEDVIVQGDSDFFPSGFAPNYSGIGVQNGIPDKHNSSDAGNGQFQKPGDPATPYYPDIRSPEGGPGSTDPLKKVGPVPEALSNPVAYKPSVDIFTSEGTKNPKDESEKIHKSNKLGQPLTMGKSSLSKPTLLRIIYV